MKIAPIDQPNFLDFEPEINPFKTRFSNDVLTLIDKGFRLVGIESDGTACCRCYSTKQCISIHTKYEMVPYERIIAEGNHFLLTRITIPYDAFDYLFNRNDQIHVIHLCNHFIMLNYFMILNGDIEYAETAVI